MNSKLNLPVGVALFAALALSLLFLMSGGILQAQQTAETYYYNENSDEPVVTLSANDPEGVTPIQWDIFVDTAGENADPRPALVALTATI